MEESRDTYVEESSSIPCLVLLQVPVLVSGLLLEETPVSEAARALTAASLGSRGRILFLAKE